MKWLNIIICILPFTAVTVLIVSIYLTTSKEDKFRNEEFSAKKSLEMQNNPFKRQDISSTRPLKTMSSPSENVKVKIFMDWGFDSDWFSFINYKSVESLLASYPDSSIEVMLPGPPAADYYKFGTLLRYEHTL